MQTPVCGAAEILVLQLPEGRNFFSAMEAVHAPKPFRYGMIIASTFPALISRIYSIPP